MNADLVRLKSACSNQRESAFIRGLSTVSVALPDGWASDTDLILADLFQILFKQFSIARLHSADARANQITFFEFLITHRRCLYLKRESIRKIEFDGHRAFTSHQVLFVDVLSMQNDRESVRANVHRVSRAGAQVLHATFRRVGFAQ